MRFGAVALLTEGEKRAGPCERRRRIVLILFEQAGDFFLTAKLEQAGGKDVTDALVVLGLSLSRPR